MGKEQAQAATTTTAEPEGSGDTVSHVDVSNLSLEQMDTLFEKGKVELKPESASGGEGQEKTKKAEEPAKPKAVAPEPEKESGDEPTPEPQKSEPEPEPEPEPAKPAVAKTEPEGDDIPERFRYKDPIDRAINAVYKAAQQTGAPISWAEAERRVKGEPVKQTEPEKVVSSSELRGSVTKLEGEVTETETALDDAMARLDKMGEDEQLYGPEHAKLQREIANLTKTLAKKGVELMDRKGELRGVEAAEKTELAEAQKQQASGREAAKARAIKLYADVADEESVLGKAVAKRIAEMRDPKHPDHLILLADSAPFTVTATVAAELGIAPKSETTPTTAKPATTTQPRTTASPPSAAKTAVKPGKPAEDAKKTFEYLRDEASLDELDEAFGAKNNPLLVPG